MDERVSERAGGEAPLRVLIIIGSTRKGRFAPTVARWFAAQLCSRGDMEVDLLDLAESVLPETLGDAPSPALQAVTPRLLAADAFVVITPEYNHSFPAPLKTLIDWHYTEWRAKPVAFVSYGGLAGGLRAVEQLRQIYAELHAVTIRDTVSFHGAASQFGADGQPLDPERSAKAAALMLDELSWWGRALRNARRAESYPV